MDKQMDKKLKKDVFDIITISMLYRYWKRLGRELNIPEADLNAIETDVKGKNEGTKEIYFQVLQTWYTRKAERASVTDLISVLKKCEMNNIAWKVENAAMDYFSKLSENSSHPSEEPVSCLESDSGEIQQPAGDIRKRQSPEESTVTGPTSEIDSNQPCERKLQNGMIPRFCSYDTVLPLLMVLMLGLVYGLYFFEKR